MFMFRITNILTRQQETCPNRDELLSVINEKSVWAEDRQESFTLLLEQLGEDGSLLDSMNLMLPLLVLVEEALAGFGLKREKKGFSLLQRGKPQAASSQEEPKQEVKQEPVEAILASQPNLFPFREAQETAQKIPPAASTVQPTQKPAKKPQKEKVADQSAALKEPKERPKAAGFIWKVFAVGALGISLGTFSLGQIQLSASNQALTKQLKALEKRLAAEEAQGQVEAVGRFFIASYYSGNEANLTNFLSKKMKSEGVDVKSDQVQSTIYEKQTVAGDTVSVTFIITIKGADESIKTNRLTLPFKPDKKSVYGYVLDGQPKTSSFGS